MGLCVKFQLPTMNGVQVMALQSLAKNGRFWAVIKKINIAPNDPNKRYYISIIFIFVLMNKKCT